MLKEIPNPEEDLCSLGEILYDPERIVYAQELSATNRIEDRYTVTNSIDDRYTIAYGSITMPPDSISLSCRSIVLENRTANINLVFSVKEFLERFDSIIIDGVVFKKEES
jgi:hypothetical protein